MARLGMDVDAVESVGKQLCAKAGQLRVITTAVDGLIFLAGGNWWGGIARQFVSDWRTLHKPAMVTLATAADDLGKAALRNVKEQREASASAGHGTGMSSSETPSSTGSSPPGIRETYGDISDIVDDFLNRTGFSGTRVALDYLDAAYKNPVAGKLLHYGPFVAIIAGLDTVKGVQDLNVMTDDTRTFEERFFAGVNLASIGIGYLGPVGTLGGIAIDISAYGAQEAMEMDWSVESYNTTMNYVFTGNALGETDFSPEGVKATLGYAVSHPDEAVEEIVRSVPKLPEVVGRMFGFPW